MFKFFLKLVCLLSFFCGGCEEKAADDSLLVATAGDNPPYEFYENGALKGFDIDLMQAIGGVLKRKVRFLDMEFGSIVPAVQSKKVDLAIAAFTPTPERALSVDFSQSYYQSPHALLIKKGHHVSSVRELSGKRLGVQLGSTHEKTAQALAKRDPSVSVVSLDKVLMLVQALKVDRIETALLGYTEAEALFEKNKEDLDVCSISELPCATGNAIVFPKKSSLLPEMNRALETLQKNGTLSRLRKKWKLVGKA